MVNTESARQFLGSDFEKYRQTLNNAIHSDEEYLNAINKYVLGSGGKEIRPILSLIAGLACGKLTEQGLFELLQIPVNWGGDDLTFCIENNLVAYLPDENQTEVLVQSIRYYQDVFRMMKNSDL